MFGICWKLRSIKINFQFQVCTAHEKLYIENSTLDSINRTGSLTGSWALWDTTQQLLRFDCIVLYCTLLYSSLINCSVRYCAVLFWNVLYCTALYWSALWIMNFLSMIILYHVREKKNYKKKHDIFFLFGYYWRKWFWNYRFSSLI